MTEIKKHISGLTTEGFPFEVTFTFSDGQEPIEIEGIYGSDDGGGTFSITKTDAGDFILNDGLGGEPERHEKAGELIPWVISETL